MRDFHYLSTFGGDALEQYSSLYYYRLPGFSCNSHHRITRTKTTENGKLCSHSCQPWRTHSAHIPPHLPLRWRTGPAGTKQRCRPSENGAPLQVKLSQTGRWGTEANRSLWWEGEPMLFAKDTNWHWEAELSFRRTTSCHGSHSCHGLKDSHQDKACQLLRHTKF